MSRKRSFYLILLSISVALFNKSHAQSSNDNEAENKALESISAINSYLLSSNSDLISDTERDSDFSDSSSWTISASTNQDTDLAFDGNLGSRWTTRETQRSGQFYQIDFNTIKTFDRVLLDSSQSSQDYPREYQVQVSQDGASWVSIANDTPAQANQIEITFVEQNARFLRIEQHGNSNTNWWSIHEMTIAAGEIPNSPDPVDPTDPNDPGDLDGLHPDITRVADIPPEEIVRNPGGNAWKDSYSVGDRCYCDTTFDHDIGDIRVDTPVGNITVVEACAIIGEGPGSNGRPIYNDVQCGNGPANDAGDEDYCPGRVDIGKEGCPQIGPTWNFD